MPECIECGAYTKYKNGLCYKCYYSINSSSEDAKAVAEVSKNGLSDRERMYRYGMIKGRIAETLIQELFLSLDIMCFVMVWKTPYLGLWNF